MTKAEITANVLNAGSIVLAGRNSVHTWWTGIAGCILFTWVFFAARLYADTTLQIFFIITSIVGWRQWAMGEQGAPLPVRRVAPRTLVWLVLVAVTSALGYAWVLARFTNASAPLPDSMVLSASVLGQLLLMRRRIENWWCWLIANTVAVPLYLSRGLTLTAILYAGFFVNALLSLRHWRRELVAT